MLNVRVDKTPSLTIYTIHDGVDCVSIAEIEGETANIQYPYSEGHISANIEKILQVNEVKKKNFVKSD